MITVGNSGAGGGVHLIALAFEKAAGVKFNHIPFAGGGPSITALLGGHVHAVSCLPAGGDRPREGGEAPDHRPVLREAIRAFPAVPTVREQGVNFTMGQWRGLAAPKGTPPDVIKTLHDAFKKGMEDPAFVKNAPGHDRQLAYVGPAEFGKMMAADHDRYAKLVQEIKNSKPRAEEGTSR